MTRIVEIYFKSENDAESARASLQTQRVNNLFIDSIPESAGTKMYIPFFPTNIGTSGTPSNAGPIGPSAPLLTEDDSERDPGRLTHLLHLEVNEEDHDQVISFLKEHDWYNPEP